MFLGSKRLVCVSFDSRISFADDEDKIGKSHLSRAARSQSVTRTLKPGGTKQLPAASSWQLYPESMQNSASCSGVIPCTVGSCCIVEASNPAYLQQSVVLFQQIYRLAQPKNYSFLLSKRYFLDQSIQKIFYFILKKEALSDMSLWWSLLIS